MKLPSNRDDMKHFSKHGACVKLIALFITKLPHITYGLVLAFGILIARHYV